MALRKKKTDIKKVQAFPIKTNIVLNTGSLKGNIIKLTNAGLLIAFKELIFLRAGQSFEISFAIPLTMEHVQSQVQLVVLYEKANLPPNVILTPNQKDRMNEKGYNKFEDRLMEVHFCGLTSENKMKINGFIQKLVTHGYNAK